MEDFKARPSTTRQALLAARDTQYPRRKGEPAGEKDRWEQRHREILRELSEMAYGKSIAD